MARHGEPASAPRRRRRRPAIILLSAAGLVLAVAAGVVFGMNGTGAGGTTLQAQLDSTWSKMAKHHHSHRRTTHRTARVAPRAIAPSAAGQVSGAPSAATSSAPSAASSAIASAVTSASTSSATTAPSAAGTSPVSRGSSVPAGTWLSGASGNGVPDGTFGAWRGDPVGIAGTWADSDAGQLALWQLAPGGEYGSWTQSVDIAIGAIDRGETWAQAAAGAYDERWRQSLTTMKKYWGTRAGTVYIRFAHEMNGNWYPWSVNASNSADFVAAWKRFRALQQQIFPASRLVFCLNRESVGNGIDWRRTFPGAQYVDVLGVDYYNHYPYVATQADWNASVDDVDGQGAPKGLQEYLDFAKSQGLPLAVPEWSGVADAGDSPAFIDAMHGFFTSHAGGGAGQLLYEIQFNVTSQDSGNFSLFGTTRMPNSAKAYQQDF